MELHGLPKVSTYKQLLQSDRFARMEDFSDRFLRSNRRALGYYGRSWSSDPLHQWSRQWEYPFVASCIERSEAGNWVALDAGSGVTFFPYYCLEEGLVGHVHCVDTDKRLGSAFRAIEPGAPGKPDFATGDLRALPYPNDSFDIAWSVSVLEHLRRPDQAIRELVRVVRPGGVVLLTFDLEVGRPETVEGVIGELMNLVEVGHQVDGLQSGVAELSDGDPVDVVTTRSQGLDRKLLPWRWPNAFYQFSCLASGHGWPQWPPWLTFACVEVRLTGEARLRR